MSILIKGMSMPKNCAECDISQAYDIRSTWCPLTFTTQAELKRQDNCPLVELPPHVINFDKPYTITISWDGKQLKGDICGSNI